MSPGAHPIVDYVVTPHARAEMERRAIDETIVRNVLEAPGQRDAVRPGRDVLQARVELPGGIYLIRVFVDVDRTLPEVVTAYYTSKVAKYWRLGP